MKITVRFFAALKESMGCEQMVVEEEFAPLTVQGLLLHLTGNHPQFAQAVADVGRLRAAVNQDMADPATPISAGCEVAFFPPVTGG